MMGSCKQASSHPSATNKDARASSNFPTAHNGTQHANFHGHLTSLDWCTLCLGPSSPRGCSHSPGARTNRIPAPRPPPDNFCMLYMQLVNHMPIFISIRLGLESHNQQPPFSDICYDICLWASASLPSNRLLRTLRGTQCNFRIIN